MKELLSEAIEVVDGVADRVGDWSRPSPCEGWTASDVLGHITATLGRVRGVLAAGSPPAAVPDQGGSALTAWRAARDELLPFLVGIELSRVVQTPFGDRTIQAALARPTADLCCHAWDIAASQGEHLELPAHLLDVVQAVIDAVPPDALRQAGLFGPAVEAGPEAGPTDRVMAWLGRTTPAAVAS
jgi:uncharacterized protein (TIGR03086 family)